jgi:hypothetical protein
MFKIFKFILKFGYLGSIGKFSNNTKPIRGLALTLERV